MHCTHIVLQVACTGLSTKNATLMTTFNSVGCTVLFWILESNVIVKKNLL